MLESSELHVLLLAAGLGTRLQPYTNRWPKCLMPIRGRPLLEFWMEALARTKVSSIMVNVHSHADEVTSFLRRTQFDGWVKIFREEVLLGTAGTLIANYSNFKNKVVLLIHADNWCDVNLEEFIYFHNHKRPSSTLISMVTFCTDNPSTCGILQLDDEGVVVQIHEKVKNPPGKLANAAIYILEPIILDWMSLQGHISDFSTQVLPHFVGRIATWHHEGVMRDIGTIDALKLAQLDPIPSPIWPINDEWYKKFKLNPIQKIVIEN